MRRLMVVMVVGLALAASACGAAVDKLNEEIAEQAVEAAGGGDVDVEFSGDGDEFSVNVETDEGSLSIGVGSEIPDELTIPLPGGGDVTTAGTQNGSAFAAVQFSQDRYDELVSFYEDWTTGDAGEWENSNTTIEMNGETQRTAQWFAGGSMILVSDCISISGGDTSFNSTCVTINEEG